MSETSGDTRRWPTLGALAGGNLVQLGTRILISPLVPLILTEFQTTKSNIGLALTGMWAVYALLQFPAGVLADRFGERRLILAGLGATAVATALVAAAPTLLAFGAFVLLLGAGTGFFFAPASSLVSRLYEARGGPLGVLTAAGGVAGVIFPAVGGYVGFRFGWRAALGLGAVSVVPVVLAIAVVVPTIPPANPDRRLTAAADVGRVRELLTRRSVLYTMAIAFLTAFSLQGLTSFLPTFLVEFRHLTEATAGLVFGGIYALSSLAQPVVGRISDRFSRDAGIALSVSLAAVGLLVFLFVGGRSGLVVAAGLYGAGLSWMGPIQARFMDQLADEERGYGFGLIRTTYMVFAATGSVVVGTLADVSDWVAAFGLVVVLFGVCLVALALNRGLGLDL